MICLVLVIVLIAVHHTRTIHGGNTSFTIDTIDGNFLLNGQPFVFVAGALHYFRVPRAYWRHRLSAMRRAGFNTLHTSLEWSSHEPKPGTFLFEGQNDFVTFIRMAGEEGLWTVVRPGPFIDANRDLGGLPAWLLWQTREERGTSSLFTFRFWMERYLTEILKRLRPLMCDQGGTVLLLEVENFLGNNTQWIINIMKQLLGPDSQIVISNMLTSQERSYSELSIIDVWGMIFSSTDKMTDSREIVSTISSLGPRGPWMNMNVLIGMPGMWGVKSWKVFSQDLVTLVAYYFHMKVSFCLVMFHGGTNFGFSAGAIIMPGTKYFMPYITSNDMMAPMKEDGSTRKTFPFKRISEIKYLPLPHLQELSTPNTTSYGTLLLQPASCLLDNATLLNLASTIMRESFPITFEELQQSSGFVLYQTVVPANLTDAILEAPQVHDRAQIYVDKVFVGLIRRFTLKTNVYIKGDLRKGQVIDILVENEGRSSLLFLDPLVYFKGLTYDAPIQLGMMNLDKWTVYGIPMDDVGVLHMFFDGLQDVYNGSCTPVFYKGEFLVPEDMKVPAGTHLDMTGWTKGVIFVNGHNLGRYWPKAGPQVTLYLPGCFLNPSPITNKIVVFEMVEAQPEGKIHTVDEAILVIEQAHSNNVLIALMLIPFVCITGYWMLNYLNEWIYLK